MTSEALTFTRDQASDILCPVRDQPCLADRCAVFRWTSMIDSETEVPVGHCGLSRAPEYA